MSVDTPAAGGTVELSIGGMTCSTCSARIEKKLNRMDGVEATVNFATEKAKVTFGDGVTVDDLVATVEATGYTAAPPRRRRPERRLSRTGRRGRPRGPGLGEPDAVDALRRG